MRPRRRYNIIIYYNVRAPRAASTADAVREIILLCVRRKDSKNFALMVRRTIVWGFLRGHARQRLPQCRRPSFSNRRQHAR